MVLEIYSIALAKGSPHLFGIDFAPNDRNNRQEAKAGGGKYLFWTEIADLILCGG